MRKEHPQNENPDRDDFTGLTSEQPECFQKLFQQPEMF